MSYLDRLAIQSELMGQRNLRPSVNSNGISSRIDPKVSVGVCARNGPKCHWKACGCFFTGLDLMQAGERNKLFIGLRSWSSGTTDEKERNVVRSNFAGILDVDFECIEVVEVHGLRGRGIGQSLGDLMLRDRFVFP